jgi:acylphosphatase
VVVTGVVQGVGFRDWTRRRARDHRVGGWVGNREDGAVEAVIEGPEDAVAAVIAALGIGPVTAIVDSVEVIEEHPLGETEFQVLR